MAYKIMALWLLCGLIGAFAASAAEFGKCHMILNARHVIELAAGGPFTVAMVAYYNDPICVEREAPAKKEYL